MDAPILDAPTRPDPPIVPPMRSFKIIRDDRSIEVLDAHSISIDDATIMFFRQGVSGMKYCQRAFAKGTWRDYEELTTTALSEAIN